jgi:DNA topoisomerase I
MSYALVVCEKASAAKRIAQALGTLSFERLTGLKANIERKGNLLPPVFSATNINGLRFVICSAIGHLYGLVDAKGNRNVYPVFDIKWMPIAKRRNGKGRNTFVRSKLVISMISELSQNATSFIHACDYDQEGEVIGYNILEYACNNKYEKSLRAKFSTLTDEEIRYSFNHLSRPSRNLAEAGRSRHMLDFIYGINLSRGLTQSFKISNDGKRYYNISIGRVQGPSLAFVVDREISIRKHIPTPYWNISAQFERSGYIINANYYPQKIDTLSKAISIVNSCRNQDGMVTEVKHRNIKIKSPYPFNLGDLQKEAHKVFNFSPSYTLHTAEKLYLNALISYPRTSSQKLPPSINYRRIISDLSMISPLVLGHNENISRFKSNNVTGPYTKQAKSLLSERYLSPNEGRETDPAHPAIYPTGEKPKSRLDIAQLKLLDLVIKRFLATFGEPAIIQSTTVDIVIKDDNVFIANQNRTLYNGWMKFYKPYAIKYGNGSGNRQHLPELHNGNVMRNVAVMLADKLTEPPHRFNQASLLEKMEKEKIGTKATRASIIRTLFNRNYISKPTTTSYQIQEDGSEGGGIEATEIGVEIIYLMRKYIPKIVSTALTRSIEEQLNAIELGKTRGESIIEYATADVKDAIIILKQNKIEIGNQIAKALDVMRDRREKIKQKRC